MRASAKRSHAGWKAGGRCAKLKHRRFVELAARSAVGKTGTGRGQIRRRFVTFPASDPIY
jgi:hypothetical protein